MTTRIARSALRCTAALACIALLSAGPTGCATPQDSSTGSAQAELQAVSLSTAPSTEGMLVLRLKNDAKRPLKVDLCQATLHQWQDEAWQPSETQPDWLICEEDGESVVVNPSGLREAPFNPTNLEPGRYRFTVPIEMPVGLDFKELTSAAFDIVPPPTEDAPAEDAPLDDVPTDDLPVDDAPAEDAPTDELPTEDAPTEDAPAEDAPAEDAPATN